MNVIDQLKRLSSAEEFFTFLDVPYDPQVLNVARLHILRRMGEYLRGETLAEADEASARTACRAHLEHAYEDFVNSSPLAERVFKVLKDAVKPPSIPLVSLSSLMRKSERD
jgi:nitrogenase-stabilizing/protective protein